MVWHMKSTLTRKPLLSFTLFFFFFKMVLHCRNLQGDGKYSQVIIFFILDLDLISIQLPPSIRQLRSSRRNNTTRTHPAPPALLHVFGSCWRGAHTLLDSLKRSKSWSGDEEDLCNWAARGSVCSTKPRPRCRCLTKGLSTLPYGFRCDNEQIIRLLKRTEWFFSPKRSSALFPPAPFLKPDRHTALSAVIRP